MAGALAAGFRDALRALLIRLHDANRWQCLQIVLACIARLLNIMDAVAHPFGHSEGIHNQSICIAAPGVSMSGRRVDINLGRLFDDGPKLQPSLRNPASTPFAQL